jgi:hypothetical protein
MGCHPKAIDFHGSPWFFKMVFIRSTKCSSVLRRSFSKGSPGHLEVSSMTSDFSNIYSSGPTNSYKWVFLNSCNSGDISNELTTPARFATDWFSRENLNRKPWFFPWNMGCSCNIFH